MGTINRIEVIALLEYEKVGDDKLFPNHTDKDIWVSGFITGYKLMAEHQLDMMKYYEAGIRLVMDDNSEEAK
jgi:hypothetical protein